MMLHVFGYDRSMSSYITHTSNPPLDQLFGLIPFVNDVNVISTSVASNFIHF